MSITELIVETLRSGKQVELPGIGTFGSEMQPPHHDREQGIYYPSSRRLTFSTATHGDNTMVAALAAHECVSENVAAQMWKNYLDALTDKLQRTGSHSFGEFGTLNRQADGTCTFVASEGAVLSTGNQQPIEGVKIYQHADEDDPFARFEDTAAEKQRRAEAERKAAEQKEAERKAAEERAAAERKAAEERAAAERKAAEERAAAERKATEERAAAERKAAEERAAAERKAAEERKAEAERLAALEALDSTSATAAAPSHPVQNGKGKQNDKKRRFPWWLLLLLLLLLLLGGAAYYYFRIYRPKHLQTVVSQPAAASARTEVSPVGPLTYNTDLLHYSGRDIANNRDQICLYMADYIYSFLAYRHYTGAMVPMIERVRDYAGVRLDTLMDDRFALQRFIPYNDYIYNHCEDHLRGAFAQRQRCRVQGELLDMRLLDSLLAVVVNETGIAADAAAPAVAAAPQPRRATVETVPAEQPVRVNVEQGSKEGFDIIAGFYMDKAKAARMTARLHELGSDAYIIEKNNMYYVSMGSAKNRTQAEALFKHIKSWYDGDVAIKQW